MKQSIISLALTFLLVLALTAATHAAPSVLGPSGNIIVPDDSVVAPGAVSLGYHGVDSGGGDTVHFFAANLGIIPNLEVGATLVANGNTRGLINAKYRVLTEAASRPAVTIGVIDAGTELTSDAGIFLMLSKNITPTVEEIGGRPSRPLTGHIGVGSGALKGIFFALDWTLTPKLSLMLEFISDSQIASGGDGSMFNGGIRYAISDQVRLDLGLLDFDDLTFGISHQTLKF